MSALYNEFTDWEAVYGVIEQNIDDKEFTDTMFALLKSVYTILESDSDAENMFRAKARRTIQCLQRIDRNNVHVETIDSLIFAIVQVDKELNLVEEVSANYSNFSFLLRNLQRTSFVL